MGFAEISIAMAVSTICLALSAGGCVFLLLALRAVRAFAAPLPPVTASATGVTLLKPLHGDEPGLADNLRSFVRQDYRGPVQLVFGVADAADAAAVAVRALQDEFPAADIALVVTGQAADGNAKITNLAGMSAAISQPLLILSDSDIRVAPDYIGRTVACLEQKGVGLVTCLYRGESSGGVWSLLAAMAIDYYFFPSVLLGVRLGRARPCMGATMAFSRQTLEAIGGFAAFSSFLADDHAIGAAVRRQGQRVVVAPHLVSHRCSEASARHMLQHELRWALTVRSIDPAGFAGSLVTYPVLLAMLAGVLRGFDRWSFMAIVAACVCRLLLQWQVNRTAGTDPATRTQRYALLLLREGLSAGVFLSSFFTTAVVWRGRRFRVDPDGRMAEMKGPA